MYVSRPSVYIQKVYIFSLHSLLEQTLCTTAVRVTPGVPVCAPHSLHGSVGIGLKTIVGMGGAQAYRGTLVMRPACTSQACRALHLQPHAFTEAKHDTAATRTFVPVSGFAVQLGVQRLVNQHGNSPPAVISLRGTDKTALKLCEELRWYDRQTLPTPPHRLIELERRSVCSSVHQVLAQSRGEQRVQIACLTLRTAGAATPSSRTVGTQLTVWPSGFATRSSRAGSHAVFVSPHHQLMGPPGHSTP